MLVPLRKLTASSEQTQSPAITTMNKGNTAVDKGQVMINDAGKSFNDIVQMQQVSEAAQALTEIVVTLQGDITKFKL